MTATHEALNNPALTIALALAFGVISQSVARHLRVPGIVLLLAAGALLGPDGANVVRPETLGHALHTLVGFAVAIILFEGGMNLNIARLRREARTIQRLISIGALVTAAGGALSVRLILGWSWTLAVLFGTLVIVTGPTVISPLLKRLRVNHTLSTVLDAEGVLIDPVGAIVAVVTLEILVHPGGPSLAAGLAGAGARLGFGLVAGLVGGLIIAILLRYERVVPDGLENVFTLALVLALFQVSDALLSESGIMSVTVAGLVVGNVRSRVTRELHEFKEQLTVMLIGLLFVLLAADVRVADLQALGVPGILTVLCLMLVVRPLNVLASTTGSQLRGREKLFLCWLAPRGIVAAAVASLFAQTLNEAGIAGGAELRALVFLVIAVTVVVQGLTGGYIARLLGVRRPVKNGYAIVGANPIGLEIGEALRKSGEEVVFIDSRQAACRAAEERSFRVVYGNAVEERTILRAEVDSRLACIALTPNPEVNFLFARHVREESKSPKLYVALHRGEVGVTPSMLSHAGFAQLFEEPRDVALWIVRFQRKIATVQRFRLERGEGNPFTGLPDMLLLPLYLERGAKILPVSTDLAPRPGDIVGFALLEEKRTEALGWLAAHRFSAVEPAAPPEQA